MSNEYVRRVLSAEEEPRMRPLEENLTAEIARLWPVRVWERLYGLKDSDCSVDIVSSISIEIFVDFGGSLLYSLVFFCVYVCFLAEK